LTLQPNDIAQFYSLADIETKIAFYQDAIDNAAVSKSDQFQDMQASQKVERQSVTELKNLLGIWLKAWQIKTGKDSATAEIIVADYNPAIPRI